VAPANNDYLLQFQAEHLKFFCFKRPRELETTALGAAFLAQV